MIKISKDEARYLNAERGYRYHGQLFHTWGHNRHYYACESAKLLNDLEAYREKMRVDATETKEN